MKKLFLFLLVFLGTALGSLAADPAMLVHMTDGTTRNFPVADVTKITFEDDDSDIPPYERAAGKWILKCLNDKGYEFNMTIKLLAYDEEAPGYNRYYRVKGLGSDDLIFSAYFDHDYETKGVTITLYNGQQGGYIDYGKYGEKLILLYQLREENGGMYIVDEGGTIFHMNGNYTEMTVENKLNPGEPPLIALIFEHEGGLYLYDMFYIVKAIRP